MHLYKPKKKKIEGNETSVILKFNIHPERTMLEQYAPIKLKTRKYESDGRGKFYKSIMSI